MSNLSNAQIIAKGEKYLIHSYGREDFAIVRGQGCRAWDADGKEYLDFVGGIAVNALGHCHPAVVAAIQSQAAKLIHCSNLYWIEPQVELAALLVENSDLAKVFFSNSGAEANEGALKVARKYAKQRGRDGAYEVITARNSFHGRTLATLSATGQEKVHHNFEPLTAGFRYVPYNDLAAAEAAITEKTCAILVEPIQGEGGVIPAEPAYLAGLRKLCDEHDLLLIFDEVQAGMGRSGYLFAYQASGVVPDVVTLAKALGGGTAIGAFLVNERADVLVPGEHGATFGGNALATAAGCAAVGELLKPGFLEAVRENSAYLREKLTALGKAHASILQIRGMGMLLGVVLDRPGAPIKTACVQRGLLINCTAQTVLRLTPPLIVSKEEIDEAIAILDAALEDNGY